MVYLNQERVRTALWAKVKVDWLAEEILSDAKLAYQRRTDEIGEQLMRELERRVMLSVIDRKWRDHLYEMDYLKEGIGLRAMAQRDPLVEYQREGYVMFQDMMAGIREEAVQFLFNVEIKKGSQDLEVKQKKEVATKAELTRAFKKHMGSKMTNKTILNAFIEQIA